jgi:hypothetical protein
MNDPKCKRFFRICDEFSLCVNIGEKGYVLAEHPNERYTIFYYAPYGKGRFGRIFSSEFIELESKNGIVDVQDYVRDSVLFEALEDFYIIGFNTNDKNIRWGFIAINEDCENYIIDKKINKKSFFLCLNGKVEINQKEFKRYSYAEVNKKKKYNIKFLKENSILGLFYQL